MAHGVFIHRSDSIYDDVPSEQYQFPRQYLSRVQECVGDWIIYYEPKKVADTKGYFAIAKVREVVPDQHIPNMFLAVIEEGSYLDFGNPVPFHGPLGVVERGVLNQDGRMSGRAQAAVRPISEADFSRIVALGLLSDDVVLPRVGEVLPTAGFQEPLSPFEAGEVRVRSEYLVSRAVRDRNFRRIVLRAYDDRCAMTGLKLINGHGRAEVAAAHIRPVEENGPDLLTNGLAMSGTAHWLFDRGLITLEDDLKILVSRQVNDRDAVHAIVNRSGYLNRPMRAIDRPHPRFLTWHRQHRFKH